MAICHYLGVGTDMRPAALTFDVGDAAGPQAALLVCSQFRLPFLVVLHPGDGASVHLVRSVCQSQGACPGEEQGEGRVPTHPARPKHLNPPQQRVTQIRQRVDSGNTKSRGDVTFGSYLQQHNTYVYSCYVAEYSTAELMGVIVKTATWDVF